jgi:cation diffusion facilitator CzcD-associated flavoprotein CzcO
VVPDGDLFQTISDGKADVVTDEVSHFESDGLNTKSGQKLVADCVVMATGLKMQLLGGAALTIDGEPFEVNEAMVYKGMMISDLPNFIYAFGYTNASWTLKVDLTANYLCKLINKMERKGYDVVIPERPEEASEEDFLNLSSGYIRRARAILPKQGKKRPWKVVQNYLVDMLATRFDRLNDSALKFRKAS